MQLFEVGGCVRDEILGIKSKDIDFTVVLEDEFGDDGFDRNGNTPFEVMTLNLRRMGIEPFKNDKTGVIVGSEFLTARGIAPKTFPVHPGRALDFVLARKESDYTDGRRPDKVEPGTLDDDLARRDFTMNAIAKAMDGSYIDPFNGQQAISLRIIEAVGDPMERLTEDALRALRAMRFMVTKSFWIDPYLADAMESREVLELIRTKISDERKKDELEKMFTHSAIDSIRAFQKYPLLTDAIFAGSVGLEATMKKGRGAVAPKNGKRPRPVSHNGCTCDCHTMPGVMHMAACCRERIS